MRRTDFSDFHCSLARSLEVIGDWWTPLVIRDLFLGLGRFDELAADLGIPRNILVDRLEWLVEQDIVARQARTNQPSRHDYVLTKAGQDLVPALLALTGWGDRWRSTGSGVPMLFEHTSCGRTFTPEVRCSACGGAVSSDAITVGPGPGGRTGPGTAIVGQLLEVGTQLPIRR